MMRLILFILVAKMFLANQLDPNYNYGTFMIQFKRNYTGEEKAEHERIFNQNFQKLIQLRKKGIHLDVNNFMDWNQTQKKQFLNIPPLNIQTSPLPLRKTLGLAPPAFDWRALNRVTDVKNQGSCGSCWAFAATSQYESMIAIATKGIKYDLAQQFALECQRTYSKGCNGGYASEALKLFNRSGGIPLESKYPYKPFSSYPLKSPVCAEKTLIKLNQTIQEIAVYRNLTTEQIKQFVVDGPVTAGVRSNQVGFLQAGSSGQVYCQPQQQQEDSPDIDHLVNIVGYNETHWVIKNSWGTGWGQNGFSFLPMVDNCGIDDLILVIRRGSKFIKNSSRYEYGDIILRDSAGDGWNGNVIALRQENSYIKLGENFTSGESFGPISVLINTDIQVSIQVYTLGEKTNQIGFSLFYPNGSLAYQKPAGDIFQSRSVFKVLCLSENCQLNPTKNYSLTLKDSYGDGWNSIILAFRQDSVIKPFGEQMTKGIGVSGPIEITLNRFKPVDVIVYNMGQWTQEIGFQLRTADGVLVASREPGVPFSATSILASFCPDCQRQNLSFQTEIPQKKIQNVSETSPSMKGYVISTFVLSGVCGLTILSLFVVSIMLMKEKSRNKLAQQSANKTEGVPSQANSDLSHEKIGSAQGIRIR